MLGHRFSGRKARRHRNRLGFLSEAPPRWYFTVKISIFYSSSSSFSKTADFPWLWRPGLSREIRGRGESGDKPPRYEEIRKLDDREYRYGPHTIRRSHRSFRRKRWRSTAQGEHRGKVHIMSPLSSYSAGMSFYPNPRAQFSLTTNRDGATKCDNNPLIGTAPAITGDQTDAGISIQ